MCKNHLAVELLCNTTCRQLVIGAAFESCFQREASLNLSSQLHQGFPACVHKRLYLLPWEPPPDRGQWLLMQPIMSVYWHTSCWLQRKRARNPVQKKNNLVGSTCFRAVCIIIYAHQRFLKHPYVIHPLAAPTPLFIFALIFLVHNGFFFESEASKTSHTFWNFFPLQGDELYVTLHLDVGSVKKEALVADPVKLYDSNPELSSTRVQIFDLFNRTTEQNMPRFQLILYS